MSWAELHVEQSCEAGTQPRYSWAIWTLQLMYDPAIRVHILELYLGEIGNDISSWHHGCTIGLIVQYCIVPSWNVHHLITLATLRWACAISMEKPLQAFKTHNRIISYPIHNSLLTLSSSCVVLFHRKYAKIMGGILVLTSSCSIAARLNEIPFTGDVESGTFQTQNIIAI